MSFFVPATGAYRFAGYRDGVLVTSSDFDVAAGSYVGDFAVLGFVNVDEFRIIFSSPGEFVIDDLNFEPPSVTHIAPAISNLSGNDAFYTEGEAPVGIDVFTNAQINDSDTFFFDGGSLTVAITAGAVPTEDVLGIRTGSGVSLSGSLAVGVAVLVGNTVIGTVTADGSGGDPLSITFNADAIADNVTTLLRAITYANSNDDDPSVAIRTLTTTFSDGDGQSASVTSTVAVSPVNDAPVLGGDGALTVAEGDVVAVSTADLTATDPDNSNAQLVYAVTAQLHGSVLLGSTALNVGETFTQADILAGTVSFHHDGGENDGSFTVSLSDGSAPAQTRTVTVTVDPHVNDAPQITSNGGGTADMVTIAENTGAVTTVTATDAESTTLIYSVSGGADAGLFHIDSITGVLAFIAAPDFEAPADAGADNQYDVVVRASDGALFDEQAITVNVTDVGVDLTGDGPVTLTGTGDDDTFHYRSGFVTVDGLAGRDLLDFSAFGAAVWVSLSYAGTEGWIMGQPDVVGTPRAIVEIDNVENLVGTAFNDLLRGDDGDNTFFYTGGLDRMDGMGGSDTIDFSRFGAAVWVDLTRTASGDNEAWTRDGPTVTSGAWRALANLDGVENVVGTSLADDLRGDGNANRLIGGGGNDLLNGHGGNDLLDGGNGNDMAVFNGVIASYSFGLSGNDVLVTGEGTDTVSDTVETFRFADVTLSRAQMVAELTPPLISGAADTLTLSFLGGTYHAGGGDDTLLYRGGFVTVDGGPGIDTLDFSAFGAAVWVSLSYDGTEAWVMASRTSAKPRAPSPRSTTSRTSPAPRSTISCAATATTTRSSIPAAATGWTGWAARTPSTSPVSARPCGWTSPITASRRGRATMPA
jgi:hypothetical protein